MTITAGPQQERTAVQAAALAAHRESFDVRNPGTGEVVGTWPVHTAEDVEAAVARARTAGA